MPRLRKPAPGVGRKRTRPPRRLTAAPQAFERVGDDSPFPDWSEWEPLPQSEAEEWRDLAAEMAKLPRPRNDPQRFQPLLSALRNRKDASLPFTLTPRQVEVVADALWLASQHQSLWNHFIDHGRREARALEALRGRDARSEKRKLEERLRIAVNRILGRGDNADFREFAVAYGEAVKRTRRDKAALKQDWDDLTHGRPTRRYLWLYKDERLHGRRCPQHPQWNFLCDTCWARIKPKKLNAGETLLAIQRGHGFPSEVACRQALHRARVSGLPSNR